MKLRLKVCTIKIDTKETAVTLHGELLGLIWLILCSLLALRKHRQDNKVVEEEEDCLVLTLRKRSWKKEMNLLHDLEIFDFNLIKPDFSLILKCSNSV